MSLKKIIKEHLLLEKRILQVMQDIQTQFNFDISRTTHSFDRSKRPELGDNYNQREITNSELKEFVKMFTREIAENIVSQDIKNQMPFILKSLKWELAVPVIPIHNGGTSWTLIITTSFRESEENPFRVGKSQVVLYK